MFLGVGFHEVMILVVIIVVLLLTTRFGLLKRTCDRFLEEFRKALAGSQPQSSKKQTEQDADEICYQLLGMEALRRAVKRAPKSRDTVFA